MHLLQHTFFWIFFGFGFLFFTKKKKNLTKSKKKWAGGSEKFYSRGGKKVEEKSPRKDLGAAGLAAITF